MSLRSREVRVGLTRVWRWRVSVTWSRGAALTHNQVQVEGSLVECFEPQYLRPGYLVCSRLREKRSLPERLSEKEREREGRRRGEFIVFSMLEVTDKPVGPAQCRSFFQPMGIKLDGPRAVSIGPQSLPPVR